MTGPDDPAFRLFEGLVRHEVAALEQLHVVVCRDPRSGRSSYHGPFVDPLSALTAAADLETAAALGGDNAKVVCRVARLWEPQQVTTQSTQRSDRSEG